MAKNIGKNGSYAKVANLLLNLPEFNDIMLMATKRSEVVCLEKAVYDTDYSGRPTSTVTFRLGEIQDSICLDVSVSRDKEFYLHLCPVKRIIKEDTLKIFVENHFGKSVGKKTPVPTYNCKLARVQEFVLDAIKTQGANLDYDMIVARDRIKELWQMTEKIQSTITEKLKEYILTSEYSEGCQEARARLIVNNIRTTIAKFNDVTPEILKRALDEYIMHEIMES